METKISTKLETKITLELSEVEARALHALTVYGFDSFTETFYTHLGKHYLGSYHKGLESVFNKLSKEMPKHFNTLDEIRKKLK